MGLIIHDEVRKAETNVERATIELQHLDTLLANAEQDLATRLEGLGLEIVMLEKEKCERARELLKRTHEPASREAGGLIAVSGVVSDSGPEFMIIYWLPAPALRDELAHPILLENEARPRWRAPSEPGRRVF